jgi:DNA-binding CsgD family transcriptional regulator
MARAAPRPLVTPSARGIRGAQRLRNLRRGFNRPIGHLAPLHWDDPRLRTLAAHLAALATAMLILAIQGPAPLSGSGAVVAVLIAIGLSALRVLSVRKPLAGSTLVLDAAGTVVLLAGTNAPISPFFILAIAGVWWAAHVPRPRSGLIYAGTIALAYALLIFPQALRAHLLAEAVEDVAVLVILAVLADWFVRVDRRALRLSDALSGTALEGNPLAIREGLSRVLGILDIPVDVVLAAAQLGLSVVQAELLAYLVLGLTNREIGDATHVSESTVRYRLTRLYRVLGVHRRHEAVRRAMALGLALPTEALSKGPARR